MICYGGKTMATNNFIELEYTKLKDEQLARIGYRDNMVYLSLVAIGAVYSFALADSSHYFTFLVLPWVNIILGWMYIVNDEKVSAIGRYIRTQLIENIENTSNKKIIFNWEIVHRNDKHRIQRKIIQCAVDLLTFPVPGMLSIFAFFYFCGSESRILTIFAIIEIVFLLILIWQFLQYEDFQKGK